MELATLDAVAQAELVRRGTVSPIELVDAAIERIERLNPKLNAVIHPRFEAARAEAAADLPDGPFRGVPTLLKDLGCPMAGEPSHSGNRLLRTLDHRAPTDAALTQSLRAAGFVIMGRTNVPEFGLVATTEPAAYGACVNPWDTTRSTGGSSGGAAAAVAAGLVPIAQGSDGGGSIRMPAAHCGLFGLKPSRGRISTAPDDSGLTDMAGHTTYGFLARTVRDGARALDVSGQPPGRYETLAGTDPAPLRIGLMDVPDVRGYPVDAEVNDAVRAAAGLLERLGHHVEPGYPAALVEPDYPQRWVDLLSPSVTALFDELTRLAGRGLEPDEAEAMAWWWCDRGARLSAADHLRSLGWQDGFRRRMADW